MELSKDDYERTGLQGSPIDSGGRKHVRSRYCEHHLQALDQRISLILMQSKWLKQISGFHQCYTERKASTE